jgi:hypothetical protein
MSGRAPLLVLGFAVLTVVAHAALMLWQPRSGLETLPIFVPTSLSVERGMRAERDQPAGRGGTEAVALADALLRTELDETSRAAVALPVSRIKEARSRLLDARNRRHALNVRLMRAATRLGMVLTGEQWEVVLSTRDAVRAGVEADLFERLDAALSGDSAPLPGPPGAP